MREAYDGPPNSCRRLLAQFEKESVRSPAGPARSLKLQFPSQRNSPVPIPRLLSHVLKIRDVRVRGGQVVPVDWVIEVSAQAEIDLLPNGEILMHPQLLCSSVIEIAGRTGDDVTA